ncbi:hypothetical protein DFH06DRAFT_356969 [Mycena polygramma]|nr:hypothetical protein DFH06DRAFT_356969 [Mycena polygramma]
MDRTHPFQIQELVDHVIVFLRHSPADLMACALVSRVCVFPAQSYLFREIIIGDAGATPHEKVWSRLQQILQTAPHLIRHFRRLEFRLLRSKRSNPLLSNISHFPFTHLQYIRAIFYGDLQNQHALAFQQLFSIPTVRHIRFRARFVAPEPDALYGNVFLKVFARCTVAIRHFDIQLATRMPLTALIDWPVAETIPLTSLRIGIDAAPNRRIFPTLSLFDLSSLRALSISGFILTEPEWQELATATKTIEILCIDFHGPPCIGALDISVFPALSVLPVGRGPHSGSILRALVATIPPIHSIHTIVISVPLGRDICDEMDEALSALRVSAELVDGACSCVTDFPKLSAIGRLGVNMDSFEWWENTISNW